MEPKVQPKTFGNAVKSKMGSKNYSGTKSKKNKINHMKVKQKEK